MTSARTTAAAEGAAWSSAASGWVEHWAGFAAPAREGVARRAGIEPDGSYRFENRFRYLIAAVP